MQRLYSEIAVFVRLIPATPTMRTMSTTTATTTTTTSPIRTASSPDFAYYLVKAKFDQTK